VQSGDADSENTEVPEGIQNLFGVWLPDRPNCGEF
jgi:hypothetical protein